MSESHKKEILEAIDHLRARKARPDINRICAYLLKRHAIVFEDTKKYLARCVEEASVFRVEYKGFISYRNAEKSLRRKFKNKDSRRGLTAGANLLMRTFAEIRAESPVVAEKGVSRFRLISTMIQQNPKRSHGYFNHFIDKAINCGLFIKLKNGNFIPKTKPTKPTEKKHDQITTPKSKKNPQANRTPKTMSPLQRKHWMRKQGTPKATYRSLERRKRIMKKIFDPSENTKLKETDQEKSKKNNTIIENQNEDASDISEDATELPEDSLKSPEYRICSVCQTLVTSDERDNKVTACVACSSISHFRCAYVNPHMKDSPENAWKCPQCICCTICKRTGTTSSLISCANCTFAYHRKCHRPNIKDDIQEHSFWLCFACDSKEGDNIIIKSKFFCTPGYISRLKYEPSEHKKIWEHFKQRKFGADEDELEDPTIPDVKNWTTDQVYEHMQNVCPEAAVSFKERDIDGPYLLKMSRVEVTQGLGLKLGPALKIFKEVIVLQKRRDDPKSYYL